MPFEKLTLTAFTEAVVRTLKNNKVDIEIQKNIVDNISIFFKNANSNKEIAGRDDDLTTLNEAEYNQANKDIEERILLLRQQTQQLQNGTNFGVENQAENELSYTDKMKQSFSIISDATYFEHKNEEVRKYAGQLRKNGENVVIIKMQDGTYTTIRQTTKNNTETKNYKNLEELKNDMANENYGWGRNSWGNIPFSIRDVSFIKNPIIEVVGHRN